MNGDCIIHVTIANVRSTIFFVDWKNRGYFGQYEKILNVISIANTIVKINSTRSKKFYKEDI